MKAPEVCKYHNCRARVTSGDGKTIDEVKFSCGCVWSRHTPVPERDKLLVLLKDVDRLAGMVISHEYGICGDHLKGEIFLSRIILARDSIAPEGEN